MGPTFLLNRLVAKTIARMVVSSLKPAIFATSLRSRIQILESFVSDPVNLGISFAADSMSFVEVVVYSIDEGYASILYL